MNGNSFECSGIHKKGRLIALRLLPGAINRSHNIEIAKKGEITLLITASLLMFHGRLANVIRDYHIDLLHSNTNAFRYLNTERNIKIFYYKTAIDHFAG